MGFEKFGKFGYVSQTKIMPLLSYLEKEQIPATRCTKCKMTHFPPRADCPNCRGDSVEWITLGGSCRLVTFTQVHFAPPAFQPDTPYSLGVAELNNGLRVFAPINQGLSGKKLKVGMKLVLRTRRSGEGLFYQLESETGSPSQLSQG
jgi:uncharacterized OB-fold protein